MEAAASRYDAMKFGLGSSGDGFVVEAVEVTVTAACRGSNGYESAAGIVWMTIATRVATEHDCTCM